MPSDEVFRAVLDCLPTGALIADADGNVVFANTAAQDLLERGLFTCDAARLTEHLRFRAHRPSVERLHGPGSETVHASFIPVGTLTVVLMHSPARDPQRLAAALGSMYGLTPQEQRVAIAIHDGRSLAEAAGTFGIEISTARTHLKSVFAKTYTRRQSTLALLVASCAAAASACRTPADSLETRASTVSPHEDS